MTKLKKKFMVNHDGENWVVLDDFMALKGKLKKTQKEYAKARNQLKEANKVIKFYSDATGLTEEERQMSSEKYHLVYGLKACDYLERYGVK